MRAFQPEDYLLVREAAVGQDAAGCAAALLARAYPGDDTEALQRLPLGRRNARLLALHERLFGPALEAYAECPHCGEKLEFALRADAFPRADESVPAELALEADGHSIRFRLLDSRDVLAAAACRDVSAARALLIERCVLEARRGDAIVAAAELPPTVIEELGARIEEADPQAELLLDLACPGCERVSEIAFDVASFLFAEVDAEARRVLREVHALARAYGWREADILAMPARRRRAYLEMLLQ